MNSVDHAPNEKLWLFRLFHIFLYVYPRVLSGGWISRVMFHWLKTKRILPGARASQEAYFWAHVDAPWICDLGWFLYIFMIFGPMPWMILPYFTPSHWHRLAVILTHETSHFPLKKTWPVTVFWWITIIVVTRRNEYKYSTQKPPVTIV